ncbi:uncharacterized protein [Rhodnius prolixus]|uniref:uncharacterized protein n=1 Tax=Rhodnius prolixus TaxID=13249 RepID=UPI003D189B13
MGTKSGIWLLEKMPNDEFLGARLPSEEQVLLVFILVLSMLDEDTPVQGFLEEQCVTMVNYIQNVLKEESHPREDYKEFLNLPLLYLGGWNENNFTFRIPGALNQARWMAKALYALKIALFAKQLNMSQREFKGMKRVVDFTWKEKTSHFVTQKTKTFFELFEIYDVTEYCSDSLRSHVNALKVVNDAVEREIVLIKKFNESVRDEQQKQFLLRAVEYHREVVTNRTKEEIASYKIDQYTSTLHVHNAC